MYSSVNNRDSTKSILAWYELLGIIVVFAFMLYLLFPKQEIEQLVDTQADHANLSVHYLESMILYYPDNHKLKFSLMEKYRQLGEEKKALSINRELMETTSTETLRFELYKIEYLLEKNLYFKRKNSRKLKALKEKLLALYHYPQKARDTLFFFGEATNIDDRALKYTSLIAYLEENPKEADYNLEKMAYDLASELGHQEAALQHLEALMKYPNTDEALSEYLIYTLYEKQAYSKAKEISTQLFLSSQTDEDLTKHFHLALYALIQDKSRDSMEISQLIETYANLKTLLDADIGIILNSLLELGETQEAANFVMYLFESSPESFGSSSMDLAIESLLYTAQLPEAQMLSLFALSHFETQHYLDKSIQISTWMSDDEAVRHLNTQGYHRYQSDPYLSYFLKQENLNKNHDILGQIYAKKIAQKKYDFIPKMAAYYRHTGEIPKAQSYFKTLYAQTKQRQALYYAVMFAHHNSEFEESFKRYRVYQRLYGNEATLQELVIEGLMANQKFEEAHAMAKALEEEGKNKKQSYLSDLAWWHKDYAYLHQELWELEANKQLTAQNFEQLILLEKALTNQERLPYLYEQSWQKAENSYHLTDLLYALLEKKDLEKFDEVIEQLSAVQKKRLKHNSYYQELLAEYYVQTHKLHLALETYDRLLKLNPNNTVMHQNYLWLLLDNHANAPFLAKRIETHLKHLEKDSLLREAVGLVAVVTAMHQKAYPLAKKWIHRLIMKHPKQIEYQALYRDLERIDKELLHLAYFKQLNPDYLDTKFRFSSKRYGSQLHSQQTQITHQWQPSSKMASKLILNHYDYAIKKRKDQQNSLAFTLRNMEDDFLWHLQLGMIEADKHFLTGSLELTQKVHHVTLNLQTDYQNKTELTPYLSHNALENSLRVRIQNHLNAKTFFALEAEKSEFKGIYKARNLGEATHLQLSANHVLRSGYPDLSFNAYLGHHSFSKSIAKNFSEIGFAASAGKVRQHTLNHSWKPFGTVVFAINNEQNMGASAIFGVSKVVNHHNSFDVLFEYYDGIGVISEAIHELNLQYRF